MDNQLVSIITCSKKRAKVIESTLAENEIFCELSKVHIVKIAITTGYKISVGINKVEKAVKILIQIQEQYGKDSFNLEDVVEEVKRILVPVDFSNHSDNVLDFSLLIASQLNAEIMLLNVYAFPFITSTVQPNTFAYNINLEYNANELKMLNEQKMQKFIQHIKNRISGTEYDKIKIENKVIQGSSIEEIKETSKEYLPGLIVIGMHGADESYNKLMGSVTENVIENAKVPVLVIPNKAELKIIDSLNILYATNFDDADFKAIRKLMTLFYPFKIKIHCVHFSKKETSKWVKVKIDGFEGYFRKNYPGYRVICDIVEVNQIQKGMIDYIYHKKIEILSLTTHKRKLFESIYNPSITKMILQKIDIPILVFHA